MTEATRAMAGRQPEAPDPAWLPRPIAGLLFGLLLGLPSAPVLAQGTPPPAAASPGTLSGASSGAPSGAPSGPQSLSDEERARCDSFARLHRYAEQSKAMCEEGRQVKPGPMTTAILERCRVLEGDRFDRQPVDDMMDTLARQISEQGIGNACHAASVQAWNLISQ